MPSDFGIVCYAIVFSVLFLILGFGLGAGHENSEWREKICLEKSGIYHEGKCFTEEMEW